MSSKILIGCEAFIKKENSLLLGLRKNCFGAGTWGLPGGHLEPGEKIIETIQRELKEEIGITFPEAAFTLVTVVDGTISESENHYLHTAFSVVYNEEEIKNIEPEKCEKWKFFEVENLPENIFPPHKKILANYLANIFY